MFQLCLQRTTTSLFPLPVRCTIAPDARRRQTAVRFVSRVRHYSKQEKWTVRDGKPISRWPLLMNNPNIKSEEPTDGETTFPAGKYKGATIETVVEEDFDYAIWFAGYCVTTESYSGNLRLLRRERGSKKYWPWWHDFFKRHSSFIKSLRRYLHETRLCFHCGSRMPPIGSARFNGADHDDWETRAFHKKCWMNRDDDE